MSISVYFTSAAEKDLAEQLALQVGDAVVVNSVFDTQPQAKLYLLLTRYTRNGIDEDLITTTLTALKALVPGTPSIILVVLHEVKTNASSFDQELEPTTNDSLEARVDVGFIRERNGGKTLVHNQNTNNAVRTIEKFLEGVSVAREEITIEDDEQQPPVVGIPYNMKIAVHTPPMPPLNHMVRFTPPDIDANTAGMTHATSTQACQWFVRSVDILQVLHSRGPQLRWKQTLDLAGVDDDNKLYTTLVALYRAIGTSEDTQPLVVKVWLNGGGCFVYTPKPDDNPADPELATFGWHFLVNDNNASLESVLDCGAINHRHSDPPMYLHTLPGEFIIRHAKPLLVKTSGLKVAKQPYTLTLGPVVSGRVQRYALHSGMAKMRSTDGSDRLIAFVTDYYFQRLGLGRIKFEVYEIGTDGVSSFSIPPNTFLDNCRLTFTHWRVVYDEGKA